MIRDVEYEMALIRVDAESQTRGEIMQLVDIYRADIVDVDIDSVIIRIVAREDRVNALLRLLEPFGIKEMVRTGRVAMVRGSVASQEQLNRIDGGRWKRSSGLVNHWETMKAKPIKT